jgi:glycosyltransferase involved in cell wall biosynthesis
MRILICYPWLELGGAPKTSITLAKGLKERGHEVFFFSKGGGMYEPLLEEAGIPLISAPYHSSLPLMFHLNGSARRMMKTAIEEHSIDVVHVFHPNHYFLALLVAPLKDVPVVFTAVWHLDRHAYPVYPGRLIFVAEEFLDHIKPFMGKHAREMTVIPNRVDLDRFGEDVDWTGFTKDKGLPATGIKIAFMSRLGSTKEKSVYYAMDAVRILLERGTEATLAVAGDGPLYDQLAEYGDRINGECGRKAIRFIGSIEQTPEFMSWADIVLGIGRSSFEGMAARKPTCIVGEKGLAGVVSEDTVKELQYYNFAGRNVKTPQDPALLADTIADIMSDEETYERLAEFSRRYVIENYGYRAGAKKIEQVYIEAIKDGPLSRYEKIKAVLTAFSRGYCRSLFATSRGKVKKRLLNQIQELRSNRYDNE